MGLILQKGRPYDLAERPEKERRVYDLLDALKIEYERIDRAPAMTMEVCRDIDEALGATICKNLFLCNRQKTQFYLLMIPGDKTECLWPLSGGCKPRHDSGSAYGLAVVRLLPYSASNGQTSLFLSHISPRSSYNFS